MNQQQLAGAVDEIAVRVPERGCGYADSQRPWRHDPAIEHVREVFLAFLAAAAANGRVRTAVSIGLGRRGGTHRALRTIAERVVTVAPDPQRLAAFAAAEAIDPARDTLLPGDPGDDATVRAVAAAAPCCDLLLLDGSDRYEEMRGHWASYAPLVAANGLVAIVDRAQAEPGPLHPFGVDRFVADLQRDFLAPRGVRCQRLGGAHAIHVYRQTAATRALVAAPALPDGFVPAPRPRPLGRIGGFTTWSTPGRCVAIPAGEGSLCPRRLARNDYGAVLCSGDAAGTGDLVAAFERAEPELAAARELLRAGQDDAAAARTRAVAAQFPLLQEALVPCLGLSPWNHRLLLALGTLHLYGPLPRGGACLLRRALDCDPVDAPLLQVVAAAYLRVLQDAAGARTVLDAARRHVRQRKVAAVCHRQRAGHALWHYPLLLAPIRSVVHVGAHRGEDVDAWCQLEIPQQTFVEANPAVFDELERRCRTAAYGRPRAVLAAVAAAIGSATLRCGDDTARGSLLRQHPLAKVPDADVQRHEFPVATTALDELWAQGRLGADCDLLFVDTEGSELAVLQGATELLRHVDVLCIGVFTGPVYAGAPLPQEIQSFLFELHGGDGFVLCAFEPGRDGVRGQAVFCRRQPREDR